MMILGWPITFGGDGTTPSPPATPATGKGWGHKVLRRIVFMRPVRANPTPIVEEGQTEDPT